MEARDACLMMMMHAIHSIQIHHILGNLFFNYSNQQLRFLKYHMMIILINNNNDNNNNNNNDININ